jgi:hypothetical protein
MQPEWLDKSSVLTEADAPARNLDVPPPPTRFAHALEVFLPPSGQFGWPWPSQVSADPEEARSLIELPQFDALLLEKARVISGRYALAESEYRANRAAFAAGETPEIPHFEKVFRVAAALAGVPRVETSIDYDILLVLTAWHTVRPELEGFLSSYPKALLCPLPHLSPPTAIDSLSPREQLIFERRAPTYLRYLLLEKFQLRTCADLENADMRHLLRGAGFRLIRPSAVAEFCFPGITQGSDPPIRPWKLTLRQELSDDRAAELLITAALWQIRYGLRLVSFPAGSPEWNIGAFGRTDWEDSFLSLGVRLAPSLMRESGLLDWRKVLSRCLDHIGRGNLPAEVLGKVSALPQRICHDDHQAIWDGLDQVAATVVNRVHTTEPSLFTDGGGLDYENARSFRRWARCFDEISPQILSRFGVSAFTALRRVAPQYFGWGCAQLKPWELEQEYGKWKGARGRALLRSAYAYALYEQGLGTICDQEHQVTWQCNLTQFASWHQELLATGHTSAYDFLYGLARRHGLTPLLNREISHTAAISLLAGINLHEALPRIEGCWDLCLRTALEHHGGQMEVRLDLPDLVPLPLRLRKAALTPLTYSYLHKELRLVRDFDLSMARESHRQLAEIPGWWEDERVTGTPLEARLRDTSDAARAVLRSLWPDPWLEPPAQRLRFRALRMLLSPHAASRPSPASAALNSAEIRAVLQLAYEATLLHTNVAQVSLPAVQRAFERLLAREDTREMLDSLLLHIGTAYETEAWGHVRKFIALDVVNDVLALTIRCSLLHLMSTD